MTSRAQIEQWFDRGIEQGKRFMVVVCDTFDYEDYPVFTDTDQECTDKVKAPGDMQRVMEVYDLRLDKNTQLNTDRCWSLP
jgi:hypothetical protein